MVNAAILIRFNPLRILDAPHPKSQNTANRGTEGKATQHHGDLQRSLRHHLKSRIRVQDLQQIQATAPSILPDQRTIQAASPASIRAISKVVESYGVDRRHIHTFDPRGAIVYDQRIMSFKGLDKVSLTTAWGRETILLLVGDYAKLE